MLITLFSNPQPETMQEEELQRLIDKFLNGTASLAERENLDKWYQQKTEQEVIWVSDDQHEKDKIERQMLKVLESHVRAESGRHKIFRFTSSYSIAAAIAVGFLIFGYYFYNRSIHISAQVLPVTVSAPAKTNENRFIVLPDSSTVILHPGSSIHYAEAGHERQLILSGEAYFDIRHMPSRPFVVLTGAVKTTVLGTAFNIKAYAGQAVTVSVTRGKVSVLNSVTKDLAILLPNQQVVSNGRNKNLNLKTVKAQQLTKWTETDMQFDEMPYKELAGRLSRRYDFDIRFKNPEMEKCLITGRFTGTENLEQVLQVISQTMGSTYKINKSVVILDGAGCVN